MHFSDYVAIFLVVLLCMFLPVTVYADINSKVELHNDIYTEYMTVATHDAVKAIDSTKGSAFKTEAQRTKCIKTFYKSLYENFGNSNSQTANIKVNSYIPCVLLIDNDGAYIHYRADYKTNGKSINNYTTTSIYTYSGTYGNFNIRFFIDDSVIVYQNGEKLYEGKYNEVYEQMIKDGYGSNTSISFMRNKDSFENEKQVIITQVVTEQVNYYINAQNQSYINKHDSWYSVTIPSVAGENWARALAGPTVLAFFQGPQMPYYTSYRNIYSIAGGKTTKSKEYYIKKVGSTLMYHEKGCTHLSADDRNERTYISMKECAKKGAYPCPDCIK